MRGTKRPKTIVARKRMRLVLYVTRGSPGNNMSVSKMYIHMDPD
jgi:hypothetical protein